MSILLRYTCHEKGVPADTEGWVQLHHLARHLGRPRDYILFVVFTSYKYRAPRFEVKGDYPEEFIRATRKNETVVAAAIAAARHAGQAIQNFCEGEASRRQSTSEEPQAAAGRAEAAAGAVEWVEIPGSDAGARAFRCVATGQVCRELPPSGWVELLHEGFYPYYWHVGRQTTQWEQPQPVAAEAAPSNDHTRRECCVVCMARDKSHAIVPCGHLCACGPCAALLLAQGSTCPMCRTHIENVMEIFGR